jgi:hypothetical protein
VCTATLLCALRALLAEKAVVAVGRSSRKQYEFVQSSGDIIFLSFSSRFRVASSAPASFFQHLCVYMWESFHVHERGTRERDKPLQSLYDRKQ